MQSEVARNGGFFCTIIIVFNVFTNGNEMANLNYCGRLLIEVGITQGLNVIARYKGIINGYCQRCQAKILKHWKLPDQRQYCWNCAVFGRITSTDMLVGIEEPHLFEHSEPFFYQWKGELTKRQAIVASGLLNGIKNHHDQLLFAVTGAGKTEILYWSLKWAIERHNRIAYLSPRIDVIREITPRIMEHFKLPYTILYSEVEDTYQYTQIVFATIHQMYKFYHAFDLIIVDEADAYPFQNNQSLWYALAQCRSDNSVVIYMTATKNKDLKNLIQSGKVREHQLLNRYHGKALPNLSIKQLECDWRIFLPKHIKNQIKKFKGPWLIFVPKIEDLKIIYQLLIHNQQNLRIVCLSSKESERERIVNQLKQGAIDIICTTIILERGITISNVQIMILGCDENKYSDESLLQIAGRSGRDKNYSTGAIYAYCYEITKQLKRVKKEIDVINERNNL